MRIFFPSAAELITDQAGHGEGLIAWNLLSGLAARGHEIVACVKRADLNHTPAFEVVELDDYSSFDVLKPLAYARSACRELQDRGPDQFDVLHWLFPDSAPGFPLKAACNLPLIIGPIVQPWGGQKWWPLGFTLGRVLQPLYNLRMRRLFTGATAILAAEPGARTRSPQSLASRVQVLPFGLALDNYHVTSLPTVPRVLYLGRLTRHKRVEDLIAAFPRVRQQYADIELVIAGEGPCARELQQQAHALGIGQAVQFVGTVTHNEVPKLIDDASVLCLPSCGEPFGMVLVEAMACGRAVVATHSGGPAWIVNAPDGGRLVPPCAPTAIADALIDLLADRSRLEAYGLDNRARVEDVFDLERVLDRLEAIYDQALDDIPPSPGPLSAEKQAAEARYQEEGQ